MQTLIEHWDGSVWTIVHSHNPGTSGNYLQAITEVPTSGDLWAVGYYYESGHPHTLIERWDGINWQVVPSPTLEQQEIRFLVCRGFCERCMGSRFI